LAPIAGPGSVELAAAVANAGAFAFLPCAYSDPERMRDDIQRLRTLTDRPFGVNIFIDEPLPHVAPEQLIRAERHLDAYRRELGIPTRAEPPIPSIHYEERVRVVLEERPRAFSCTFGVPDRSIVVDLRAAGVYTVGTATTVDEALAIEAANLDVVCAQGAEAGGHRGSFLHGEEPPLIGTMALVPQIVDAVGLAVIAAGGISDGHGIAAALALGASAAALGTAFLLATEAATPNAYRAALKAARASETTITRAFSGRAARGIVNRVVREMPPDAIAPYPYQNALTRDVRNAAAAQDRSEFLSLWAGQAFPFAREEPAAQIVQRLLEELDAS
jgi:nitronate monooxygenase